MNLLFAKLVDGGGGRSTVLFRQNSNLDTVIYLTELYVPLGVVQEGSQVVPAKKSISNTPAESRAISSSDQGAGVQAPWQ